MLSALSIQQVKVNWEVEYEGWKSAAIEEVAMAYLWADGIHVKAGIGKEKAALLVVIGGMKDGSKLFLDLESGYRESKESWVEMLRQLKIRGLRQRGFS
ncbi:MAG: transposase [Nitrososphaerales archaeon]